MKSIKIPLNCWSKNTGSLLVSSSEAISHHLRTAIVHVWEVFYPQFISFCSNSEVLLSLNSLRFLQSAKGWDCSGGWAGPWMVGKITWWILPCSLGDLQRRREFSWECAASCPPALLCCLWAGAQGSCWGSRGSGSSCQPALRAGEFPPPWEILSWIGSGDSSPCFQ